MTAKRKRSAVLDLPVVAVEVVTTGGDVRRDRVVDIGAVLGTHSGVSDRFSALVGGGDVPAPTVLSRLGVDRDRVLLSPGVDEVLTDFVRFLPEDCVLVAHCAAAKQRFLRKASGGVLRRRFCDTLRLSGVLLPSLMSHGIPDLCAHFGIAFAADGRAVSTAERVFEVWFALLGVLRSLPGPARVRLSGLLSRFRSEPLGRVFRACAAGVGDPSESAFLGLFGEEKLGRRRAAPKPDTFSSLDAEEVAGVFSEGGGFDSALGGYEARPEQVRMSKAVATAFNASHHLLVEAGTGVGKSLAYSLPAVLWSLINRVAVVLSTNTKNLQRQLFEQDLPLVSRALGVRFRSALIKGRRNYLCLRRMLYLIRYADTELERDERLPFASVLCWSLHTESGDLSESLVGDLPSLRVLTSKLVSVLEECGGPECPHRGRCFLQRARHRALKADIVVANHAVVLSEIGMMAGSSVLPPFLHMVFDEAHNLEDAATSAFSIEVSPARARFVLGRVWRRGRRRRECGLLASLITVLSDASLGVDGARAREQFLSQAEEIRQCLVDIEDPVGRFFGVLDDWMHARGGGNPSRRVLPGDRETAQWVRVSDACRAMAGALQGVQQRLADLLGVLSEIGGEAPEPTEEFVRELTASMQWLKEFLDDAETLVAGTDPNLVYWIEGAVPGGSETRACGAPIDVGRLLNDSVYSQKESVVFTSATLAVRGSTAFLKRRLGTDLIDDARLDELILGTPFDFGSQCRVLAPVFLPDPGGAEGAYTEALVELLAAVVRCRGGGLMALFTSHDMLRRTHRSLRRALAGSGIRVLAQGVSGSRDRIIRLFREAGACVLLGTHSFWEGVDVVGEALSCLVLCRLPFPVHTDPIVAARCEEIEDRGGNAFRGYSLPRAVIRFRQGFGRLIRHRRDRGIVVVTDRRLVTRRYGSVFRDSLPVGVTACRQRSAFLDSLMAFFRRIEGD